MTEDKLKAESEASSVERLVMREFSTVLTVRELKELIKDWPEKNKYNEDCEVWVETGKGLSSPVVLISPLNMRKYDEVLSADIIFKTNAFK